MPTSWMDALSMTGPICAYGSAGYALLSCVLGGVPDRVRQWLRDGTRGSLRGGRQPVVYQSVPFRTAARCIGVQSESLVSHGTILKRRARKH